MRVILPLLLRFSCPKTALSLREVGARVKNFDQEIPWSTVWEHPRSAGELAVALGRRQSSLAAQMNVRRLPRLAAQLDFARKLGMDDLVEHTSSIVWIGHSPGSFHDDFADNVVVQLTGTATFIIFPAQCAWLLKKSVGRNRTLAGHAGPLQWVRRGMKRGKGRAPFYHVALKPGDGLAVPSTSMHKVISRDSRRLALNAFFEARPGRMQWPGAPANAFYRHDQSALAMRNLWIKTLRYLWESREVAIAMHTERIELI